MNNEKKINKRKTFYLQYSFLSVIRICIVKEDQKMHKVRHFNLNFLLSYISTPSILLPTPYLFTQNQATKHNNKKKLPLTLSPQYVTIHNAKPNVWRLEKHLQKKKKAYERLDFVIFSHYDVFTQLESNKRCLRGVSD